ncbi:MAG: DUF6691 family protein [Dehalococcoidia bacterium]
MKTALYVLFGAVFGLVLSRSGAADYNFIQGMFLFEEFQLYGIIGTAVAVTAPGLWLIKRYGKTAWGTAVSVEPKPGHRGNIYGGALFGIGWAITGMCPGPVLVNVGEGKVYALAALAGVLVGSGAFGVLYPRLAKPFGLPALEVGTGDG